MEHGHGPARPNPTLLLYAARFDETSYGKIESLGVNRPFLDAQGPGYTAQFLMPVSARGLPSRTVLAALCIVF